MEEIKSKVNDVMKGCSIDAYLVTRVGSGKFGDTHKFELTKMA
jgi:hypothetical protein